MTHVKELFSNIEWGYLMGAIIALFFAACLFFVALCILAIGLFLRKRNKVIAIVLYCLAGLTSVPMVLMSAIFVFGFVESKSTEREHEEEYGGLITAIVYRKTEKALSLIDGGYDLTRTDANGNTALHRACMVDDKAVVTALLKRNIDVNAENGYHETALLSCIHYMDNEMLNLLLSGGADANTVNDDGDNPILRIAKSMQFGKNHYEKVEMLLRNKCDATKRDAYGKTAKDYLEELLGTYEKTIENYREDSEYQNVRRLIDLLEKGVIDTKQ